MTLRVAQLPAADVDEGVTVDRAAAILGCDPSTVRKLLRARRLAGWRVGAGDDPGGVRVSLESVQAWKARYSIGGSGGRDDGGERQRPKRRPTNAAHNEAVAQLRALGVAV
jgi:excisionase family DNA binding protein